MSSKQTGRTRWRRFAAVLVPALGVAGIMTVAMANGAIAASFSVSGQQFKVSADSLDGTGFVQYGWVDQHADKSAQPVAISGIKSATLHNLCQSVVTTLPIVGDISLKITAGHGGTPVTASNMFIDSTQLNGDATFNNIEIGRDASTLNKGPAGAQGLQGAFGQQSDSIHIDHLQQVASSTTASTFTLPGLSLSVSSGKSECF